MICVDVKKIAGILNGGGLKVHGRSNDPHRGHRSVGYRFIHTTLDDRTRLVFSEILADEQAITADAFWTRAEAWFAAQGVRCERVSTDNGSCYRSMLWWQACTATGTA